MNNLLLKKVRIALSLTSEDIIDILEEAGVRITKGELSALLRKRRAIRIIKCAAIDTREIS